MHLVTTMLWTCASAWDGMGPFSRGSWPGGGVGQRKAQDQSGSVLWGALQEVYTIGLRAWGLGAGGQRGRRGGGNS